ncbi:MAG: TonB-dependent receptor, partial [Pseudomonadota bacterium]
MTTFPKVAAGAAFLTMVGTGSASGQEVQDIDVPAQPLSAAISELSRETGVPIAGRNDLVSGQTSVAVDGELTPRAALNIILTGTGLQVQELADGSLVLVEGPPDTSGETIVLNDIIVTARRFEESLRDVPGSVLAVPAEEIKRSNLVDLNDIILRSPNVNYIEGGAPTDAQISIRGLSSLAGTNGTGPTNGVYIDEVIINPTGQNTGLNPALFDLERIEVLYGPQGTTFGRGTIGGAINYVTAKPSGEFEAELEGEIGSFPDARVRGVINGPILADDRLNGRLSFFIQGADGFVDTPNLPDSQGFDTSDFGARVALRSEPNDRLIVDLSAAYEHNNYVDSVTATEQSIASGNSDNLVALQNTEGEASIDRILTSLRASYDTGFGTATSLTSFFFVEEEGFFDGDISRLDVLLGQSRARTTSIAQEFRFASDDFEVPLLGTANFTVGTNFSFNQDESDTLTFTGADIGAAGFPPGTSINENERSVTNFAVFGEATIEPVERLEISAGARFNVDRVKFDLSRVEATGVFLFLPGTPPFSATETFTGVSPRGSVSYRWTEDFSTYVTISTGYRSGGFNTNPNNFSIEFDEERAINYEGGFRSSWFDGKLNVNGSGFATFYKDLQTFTNVPTVTLPISIIDNAAKARSIGTEISIQARPVDGLFLGADYGLALTRFVEFADSLVGDITGERLPNAPVHSFSLIGEYAHPILQNRADAFLRGEYSYTSDFFNGVGDSL